MEKIQNKTNKIYKKEVIKKILVKRQQEDEKVSKWLDKVISSLDNAQIDIVDVKFWIYETAINVKSKIQIREYIKIGKSYKNFYEGIDKIKYVKRLFKNLKLLKQYKNSKINNIKTKNNVKLNNNEVKIKQSKLLEVNNIYQIHTNTQRVNTKNIKIH